MSIKQISLNLSLIVLCLKILRVFNGLQNDGLSSVFTKIFTKTLLKIEKLYCMCGLLLSCFIRNSNDFQLFFIYINAKEGA